jgi:hypothetical protein
MKGKFRVGFAEIVSAKYERAGLGARDAPASELLGSGRVAAIGRLLGVQRWLVPPFDLDALCGEGERVLQKLRLVPSGEPAQKGLRKAGLLGELDLQRVFEDGSEGLGTAVVTHDAKNMLGNIECQLAFAPRGLARRNTRCEHRAMTRSRGTGRPDPLQARALARLNEIIDEREIPQIEIAERSGLAQGHISNVLSGKTPEAAFYVIAKIAKAIGVSIDWITEEPRAPAAKSEPPPATGTDPRR